MWSLNNYPCIARVFFRYSVVNSWFTYLTNWLPDYWRIFSNFNYYRPMWSSHTETCANMSSVASISSFLTDPEMEIPETRLTEVGDFVPSSRDALLCSATFKYIPQCVLLFLPLPLFGRYADARPRRCHFFHSCATFPRKCIYLEASKVAFTLCYMATFSQNR